MMSKKCIVCGKSPKKMTANPAYPNKYICLECLNGFMVNMTTLEEELDPLENALAKGAAALKKALDKS